MLELCDNSLQFVIEKDLLQKPSMLNVPDCKDYWFFVTPSLLSSSIAFRTKMGCLFHSSLSSRKFFTYICVTTPFLPPPPPPTPLIFPSLVSAPSPWCAALPIYSASSFLMLVDEPCHYPCLSQMLWIVMFFLTVFSPCSLSAKLLTAQQTVLLLYWWRWKRY